MAMSKYENGLEKPLSENKKNIDWYPPKKAKVLAIDFGTSTLAVSYKADGPKPFDIILQHHCRDAYIPTVLLINDGKVEIGDLALHQYTRLEMDSCANCLFFDRVKLELQHDQDVGRETSVYASNGKAYYLIEVIAILLHEVQLAVDKYFKDRGRQHKIEEFHWVLTIPAMWGKKARDMMREAAYLGGLCGISSKKLLPLQPTYTHYPPSIEQQTNPEFLSLVYEPDAAAALCRELTPDTVQGPDATPPFTTNDFFLTVDIGGGTIDVTGHQILANGRMKRVNLPHGEIYGGTVVNEAFKTFLGKLINDTCFSKYLSEENAAENRAELMGLVYITFEITKKVFTANETKSLYNVTIPPSFISTYTSELQKADRDNSGAFFKQRSNHLCITKNKMANFFDRSIKKIHECIDRSINDIENRDNLKIIYLVGGFGGCQYIANNIRAKYGTKSLRVLVPTNPEQSVVRGACEYQDKNILEVADATYGIETCTEYDESNPVHVKSKLRVSNGKTFCEKLFQPFVQNGDRLEQDKVYIGSYLPLEKGQSTIEFHLYSTELKYVHYIDGEDGDCLNRSATIIIDNKHKTNEMVEFLLDFSGTEILVYARSKGSNERVKASVDFLSTLNKFEHI